MTRSTRSFRTPRSPRLGLAALLSLAPCELACGTPAVPLAPSARPSSPSAAEPDPRAVDAPSAAKEKTVDWDFTVMDKWHLCEVDDLEDCTLQCHRGHLPSCVRLGNIYASGTRVGKDLATAAQLYEVPCAHGIGVACSNRASIFAHDHDATHAAQYYERGCDSDDAGGCFQLADLYEKGTGVPRDPRRAAGLYERACSGGDLRGCANLGILAMQGDGVERDDARAVVLFRQACDGGNAGGCGNLGSAYRVGRGVPRDETRASELYQRACSGGAKNFCAFVLTSERREAR
jgi:hypothetical protein